MITLTIDRSGMAGDLDDLVIGDDPTDSMWLDEAITRPFFDFRRRYAPESDWVSGRQLLSAVLDASSIPAVVYLQATTTAALTTLENELAAALGQWMYDVTLSVDGTDLSCVGEICAPQFTLDSGLVKAHLARAAVVIPVNPGG